MTATAAPPELPRAFLDALSADFPGDFVTRDADELLEYGRDWTREFEPAPAAVCFPRTTDEVARVVRLCADHQVAIVPSGGRTGLAGGAVAAAGELVVSLSRMNRIGDVDPLSRTVRVQAGAVTQAVHEACAPHGLTWPVDFASKGSSQIGGNISTNAGGVKVIRHGHTRQWVLALEVVTATGDVLELNGDLEKNNTGFDLRQLFIGGEGLLGVITEATLRLDRLPDDRSVLLFSADDLDAVLGLFEAARTSGLLLSAYEFFTDKCAARLQRHRGLAPPFASSAPSYALVEVEGASPEDLADWIERALERDGIRDGVLAQSAAQAHQLWQLREGISESLAATGLPHKNDVALPLRALAPFCGELDDVFDRLYPGWEVCLFGHVGDGNIHINVMKPDELDNEEFFRRAHEADRAIFELVQSHGGSISAEHGVGLLKKDFLHYTRSAAELDMLRAIKRALDPNNLFNPGKVFDL